MKDELDYPSIYEDILKSIKNEGIRVIHKKLKKGLGGQYDPNTTVLYVSKETRGTLLGCFYICHELNHYYQHRNGEFPDFFKGFENYSDSAMAQIIGAEQGASKGAKRMLKMWGIKYEPPELKEENLPDYIKFWRKYYFS